MEDVDLQFSDEALRLLAEKAIKKKTGARALRSLLEDVMLDIMYEIPSKTQVKECLITPDVVMKKSKPLLGDDSSIRIA